MSPHVSEAAAEALANGRGDLVTEADRLHIAECAACARLVEHTAALSQAAEVTLRHVDSSAVPDLDAMVSMAMARVPAARAPVAISSRRSLAFGAAIALAACIPFAVGLVRHWPMPSDLFQLLRVSFAMTSALSHVMSGAVPGGSATASLAGVFLVGLIAVPFRILLGDAHPVRVVQEVDR